MRRRIGLFVLAALVLFGALIVLFGSVPSLFKRTRTYTVRFTDAPGLAAGAPVRRSGVRIGQVQEVILDEERGIVRVKLAIDARYSIRHSEQATLVTGLLGSDASIDFIPRPPDDPEATDRTPVEPAAELVGVRLATVNTVLNRAAEVVPTTQETLNDIRKSMQRIERLASRYEKMTPLVEETIREYRDLARSARAMVPEVRQTNNEVRELARSARQAIPDLQRTNEEVGELARSARAAMPELRQTNKEVGELARSARQAIPDLMRTNDEARELVRSTREQIPAVRQTVDDIGAAARNWSRLGERADVLVQANQDKIVKAIDDLNETLARAARLFSDENVRNTQAILTNARTASDNLPSISRSADDILQQGRPAIRRLNDVLIRLDSILADLQKLSRPTGERAERITRNLDESTAKLNETLSDVRALMRALDSADGTLRRFLKDPSLYQNVDAAAARVLYLIPRLNRILEDFEVFADKLARHPESLGVGGALRPGSGLKNPPTPPLPPGGAALPTVLPGPGPYPPH
jgi:ABC-type transporter Mla subunit MlaD